MQSTQKGNELNNSISNVSELREKFYYPGRLPRPPSLWPRAKKANRPEIYCVSPEWAMNGRERATTFLLFFSPKLTPMDAPPDFFISTKFSTSEAWETNIFASFHRQRWPPRGRLMVSERFYRVAFNLRGITHEMEFPICSTTCRK